MKTLKTFMGKGGLILVLVLAITNSVSAFAAQGTTTAANGSPRYAKTVDANGNWVWSWTTENGEAHSITVSPGVYPGTGVKSGVDDLGFEFPGRGFAYDACPSLDGNNKKKSDEKMRRNGLKIRNWLRRKRQHCRKQKRQNCRILKTGMGFGTSCSPTHIMRKAVLAHQLLVPTA